MGRLLGGIVLWAVIGGVAGLALALAFKGATGLTGLSWCP